MNKLILLAMVIIIFSCGMQHRSHYYGSQKFYRYKNEMLKGEIEGDLVIMDSLADSLYYVWIKWDDGFMSMGKIKQDSFLPMGRWNTYDNKKRIRQELHISLNGEFCIKEWTIDKKGRVNSTPSGVAF